MGNVAVNTVVALRKGPRGQKREPTHTMAPNGMPGEPHRPRAAHQKQHADGNGPPLSAPLPPGSSRFEHDVHQRGAVDDGARRLFKASEKAM